MLRTSPYLTRPAATFDEAVSALALAACWRNWARQLLATIKLWRQRAHSRRALSLLTDQQLRDIGLCRYDARTESAKPFWRP